MRRCTGKNALLQRSLLSENSMLVKKFFQGLNEEITDIIKKRSKFTIIFICKSGCHRSVAMAELTSYVLNKLNFDVGTIRHLDEPAWETRRLCKVAKSVAPTEECFVLSDRSVWISTTGRCE